MPAPPLVTPQAAGEQRLFKHSTKPVKQRLFTTSTPKNSRKSCHYCHRWKSPWQQKVLSSQAVPVVQDTRIHLLHHFSHPLLPGERWLLWGQADSVTAKEGLTDTSEGLTDTSMTSANKFILSCQEAAAVWDREGRQGGAGSVDYQGLPRSLVQLS